MLISEANWKKSHWVSQMSFFQTFYFYFFLILYCLSSIEHVGYEISMMEHTNKNIDEWLFYSYLFNAVGWIINSCWWIFCCWSSNANVFLFPSAHSCTTIDRMRFNQLLEKDFNPRSPHELVYTLKMDHGGIVLLNGIAFGETTKISIIRINNWANGQWITQFLVIRIAFPSNNFQLWHLRNPVCYRPNLSAVFSVSERALRPSFGK